jgi:NAD(P)-dependent dehydrogenase (short-subunit alcohol dehydrogenase family)
MIGLMSNSNPRTILVTGASSGIGRAAALALLEQGFRVFAAVRSERAAETLRGAALAVDAVRLETLELDVTNAGQIRAAVARVEAAVGAAGLWGLFNNAGISVAGPLEHVPIDDLRRQLEVNVVGQVAVTQAFLPLLRKARGRILTTGSIAGFFAAPALAPYSMSKYAIEAFSDALRRELRPWGVEVCLLEPGAIATDIWGKGMNEFGEVMRNPPPGLLEDYGGLVKGLSKAAQASAEAASPVEVVSRDVVHAFTAARPRTRYRMGKDSTTRKLISRLPDRWLDALVAKSLGWG